MTWVNAKKVPHGNIFHSFTYPWGVIVKMKIWLPALLLLVIGSVGLLLLRPSPLPPGLRSAPAPEVEVLRWDELRAGLGQMEVARIRQHGVRFYQSGDPDKAFLLFKTAAKRGDGWSALAVGEMYDPATFSAEDFKPSMTAFSKPNPGKALQWYQRAIDHGQLQAQLRYDKLVEQLRQDAVNDPRAKRILQKLK